MTLRVTIEIVPHGNENQTYPIYRVDVSNTGLIRDLGFGHQICSYDVTKFKYNSETMQTLLDYPEWSIDGEVKIEEFDRRDGSLALIELAIRKLEGE